MLELDFYAFRSVTRDGHQFRVELSQGHSSPPHTIWMCFIADVYHRSSYIEILIIETGKTISLLLKLLLNSVVSNIAI